jgi:hypothetical protein
MFYTLRLRANSLRAACRSPACRICYRWGEKEFGEPRAMRRIVTSCQFGGSFVFAFCARMENGQATAALSHPGNAERIPAAARTDFFFSSLLELTPSDRNALAVG